MKVAIVTPSPIPYGAGGAEKLWWGLVDNIIKRTNHQCELIKIPIKENDFWSLINAYKAFYELDVSHFDMVITGKYPGWMVKHPNHHIYMLHCLRGFYDCFHFLNMPEQYQTDNGNLKSFLHKIRERVVAPEYVFEWLEKAKNDDSIPDDLFTFPGVFARELVLYFDSWAMKNCKRFSAISQTVADRKEYFPDGATVEVNYPPSTLSGFHNNSREYFFTASRLDDAKRIKMIIEAYLKTTTDIPLKIAGTGPLSEELAAMAADDGRIEFVGYVSDIDLVEYYANAYAIIFVPYDEDYGLITIEAMKSEKPVITFCDSGGVTEFVEHGVTGLLSEPEIDLLAKNIDSLAANKIGCAEMGRAAKRKVSGISWENTIAALLEIPLKDIVQDCKTLVLDKTDEPLASNGPDVGSLRKITVASTYCFYPPQGGGQNRLFYLYQELAKYIEVEIVCLAHESACYERLEVAPNLYQVQVPKSQEHAIKEWRIEEKAGIPVTDIAMITLYNETKLFREKMLESIAGSDVVVTSHPYLFPMLRELTNKPIVHESHNVEFLLKQQMLNDTAHNRTLVETIRTTEQAACKEAVLTIVCAMDDAVRYAEVFDYRAQEAVVVANGVDLHSVKYRGKNDRHILRTNVGISEHKVAVFIGSWHQPNIESVYEIIKLAQQMPDFHFVVIGSVCGYFASHDVPENVIFAGLVTDEEKLLFLSTADVALNPMLSGSGTNLKMLDYMVSGVPVVTTVVGARGLDIPENLVVVSEVAGFKEAIKVAIEQVDTLAASCFARDTFNWQRIAANYIDALAKLELV